jgi:hypothetical protein
LGNINKEAVPALKLWRMETMQKVRKAFLGSISAFAVVAFTMVALTVGYAAADAPESRLVVSVDGGNRSLRAVLTEIAKQTSWTIMVDEKLIDTAISGSFHEIGLDSFLKRSLRGENLIVLYDEKAKSVIIRSFGSTGGMQTITPGFLPEKLNDKELQARRAKDQRAYDEYLSNPDSIDSLTGMTLGEIKAMRERDQKAYDKYLSNPDSIDPLTGKTLGEIKAMRERDQKAYDKYLANPDSIDPLTGMKLGEIKAMRERDQKEYDKYLSNPDSIDPLTGMTLGEIAALKNKKGKK